MTEPDEAPRLPLRELAVDGGFAATFELDALIETWDAADLRALQSHFHAHAAASGDGNERNLCTLLAAVATFHFRSDNATEPYGPMSVMDGRRSAIPADFSDQQLALFLDLADRTRRLDLRARLADTVWVEKRKALRPLLRRSGELALNSFLALAAQELDAGRLHEFWKAFERTTRLAVQLKSGTPEQLVSLCTRAVPMMSEQNKPGLLHRLLKLAQDWELMSGADIRETALASAEKCDGDRNWHAAVEMTLFAGTTHDKGEKAQADALRLRAAGIFERAAESVAAGSALLAAHFMERAIEIYRRVAGTKDQRERCHRRLLEFQKAINGEMSSHSHPIDLRELIEAARQAVSGKDFFDALWELFTCARSPSVAELRQSVLENAQEFPLSQMFSGTVLDRDGKPVSRFSGVDEDGDDAQSGIRHKMIELANLQHRICAQGSLRPAIQVIAAEHQIMAHRFETLIVHSPFVPEGREHVFCVAFQRMFEGKLMEAIHLLLPQVENAIRHILKQHGVVTSKVKQDMTQEDLNLNEMLFGSTGAETEKIFGADLLFDLQSILIDRFGPNLRNTIAHGKAELGDMYSDNALYFCWLVLRICCLPLAQHWNVLAHLDETGELPASQADDLPD